VHQWSQHCAPVCDQTLADAGKMFADGIIPRRRPRKNSRAGRRARLTNAAATSSLPLPESPKTNVPPKRKSPKSDAPPPSETNSSPPSNPVDPRPAWLRKAKLNPDAVREALQRPNNYDTPEAMVRRELKECFNIDYDEALPYIDAKIAAEAAAKAAEQANEWAHAT